jgi:hypothetical protein
VKFIVYERRGENTLQNKTQNSHKHKAQRVAINNINSTRRRRCRPTNTQHIPGTLTEYARHTHVVTQLGPSARMYPLELGPKPHRRPAHRQSLRRRWDKNKGRGLQGTGGEASARARQMPLSLQSSWCRSSRARWRGSRQVVKACGAWAVALARGRGAGEAHGRRGDARGHAAQRRRMRGEHSEQLVQEQRGAVAWQQAGGAGARRLGERSGGAREGAVTERPRKKVVGAAASGEACRSPRPRSRGARRPLSLDTAQPRSAPSE